LIRLRLLGCIHLPALLIQADPEVEAGILAGTAGVSGGGGEAGGNQGAGFAVACAGGAEDQESVECQAED
jgi:hypothetical protein